MARFTDEELMAYADGELPPDRASVIADACAADRELANRVRMFSESRKALRDAFAPRIEDPVPERLLKLFDEKVVPLPRKPRASWIPMALAAAVALAIGANVVMRWQPQKTAPPEVARIDDVLQNALEKLPSGEPQAIKGGAAVMPTATFVSEGGDYCREYEIAIHEKKTRGIACRDEQRHWSNIATAQTSSPTPQADEFQPASGEGSEVDVAVGSSRRLTPAEEQAAIANRWGSEK